MDNKIKLELTIEEVHSIMTAVENYRIHLINTAIKNGEDHRFDGTIDRLGALDAALYRKLTRFLYEEVEGSEKEEAPLTAAQNEEPMSDSLTIIEKARREAEKPIRSFSKEFREKYPETIRERDFIRIVDRLYQLVHNPTVKNAKEKVFPDVKLSEYPFM